MAFEVYTWDVNLASNEAETVEFLSEDMILQVKLTQRIRYTSSCSFPFDVDVVHDRKSSIDLTFLILTIDPVLEQICAYRILYYNPNSENSPGWYSRDSKVIDEKNLDKHFYGPWKVRIRIWTGNYVLDKKDLEWLTRRKTLNEIDITPASPSSAPDEEAKTQNDGGSSATDTDKNARADSLPNEQMNQSAGTSSNEGANSSSQDGANNRNEKDVERSCSSERKTPVSCRYSQVVIPQDAPGARGLSLTTPEGENRDNWEDFVSFVASEMMRVKSPSKRSSVKFEIFKSIAVLLLEKE